jgi:hypothetical protein
MAMKNHVESNHVALLQIFLEDATFEFPKSPLYREPSKKKVNVSPFNIFGFFSSSFKFKKDDLTRSSFVENPMFVVKGLLLMKIVESIWLQRMAYSCVCGLSSHLRKHLLRKSSQIQLTRQ